MPALAFGRVKRVTDPLDDKVKARLRGDGQCRGPAGYPSSSGSEHDFGDLSGFVRGFFFSDNEESDGAEEAAEDDEEEHGEGGLSDRDVRRSFYAVPAAAMIRDLVTPRVGSAAERRFRRDLTADASGAVEAFAGLRANRTAFLRAVMGSLRETGYNAGICKSRWDRGGGGLAAGSYEYIDVVTLPPATDAAATTTPPQQRYIVDVEFAGEFEIARPTAEYKRLVAELPTVLVGRQEELRRLLRILADAVRRSLRSREMHVPPWRKSRYMQAKWLGPYRRTVNLVPSGSSSSSSSSTAAAATAAPPFGGGRSVVRCRLVGFDTAAPVVIAPAARTHWKTPGADFFTVGGRG